MNKPIHDVLIACYSGTGCALLVAETLADAFAQSGCTAHVRRLAAWEPQDIPPHDLLVLVYAVHAFNAPEPIYRWLERAPRGEGRSAAVLSVSGGGEVSPNTACRRGCLRRLRRLGYDPSYERMIVMPSNWIVATSEPLAVKLLDVLPQRLARIAGDLLGGVRRRTQPPLLDRAVSTMGLLEQSGTRMFGRALRAGDTCTGCGLCARQCPAGNIALREGRPVFGNRCNLCLACAYGCPARAIRPGFGRFIVIPEGFSLPELQRKSPWTDAVDIPALTKGYLWSGVRKYLLDPDA